MQLLKRAPLSPTPFLAVPPACMPCLHAAWALARLLTSFFPLSRQAAELYVGVWAAHRKLIGPHGGWVCSCKGRQSFWATQRALSSKACFT